MGQSLGPPLPAASKTTAAHRDEHWLCRPCSWPCMRMSMQVRLTWLQQTPSCLSDAVQVPGWSNGVSLQQKAGIGRLITWAEMLLCIVAADICMDARQPTICGMSPHEAKPAAELYGHTPGRPTALPAQKCRAGKADWTADILPVSCSSGQQ